jgi:hypothetical protein
MSIVKPCAGSPVSPAIARILQQWWFDRRFDEICKGEPMNRWLRRDVLAGLMFMSFAMWGFMASAHLDAGTSVAMGPAYFPRLVSGLLLALGIAIAAAGFVESSGAGLGTWSLRPIVLVSAAGLAFAALLQQAGIVIAVAAVVLIGSFAGERPRVVPLLLLTMSLVLVSVALFVWGIGIPLPIWPNWGS